MNSAMVLNLLQLILYDAGKAENHVNVQRAALRCLCLFGLLQYKPSIELVKSSFINGPDLVSAMAPKALINLVTWHGPQVLDQAIGTEPDANYEKTQFALVDISDLNDDDLNVGVLSILFYGFYHKYDWEFILEEDNCDNVLTILGEGFAKVLLRENYKYILRLASCYYSSTCKIIYFLEGTKNSEGQLLILHPIYI
jgi:condensin complex subunit 3